MSTVLSGLYDLTRGVSEARLVQIGRDLTDSDLHQLKAELRSITGRSESGEALRGIPLQLMGSMVNLVDQELAQRRVPI